MLRWAAVCGLLGSGATYVGEGELARTVREQTRATICGFLSFDAGYQSEASLLDITGISGPSNRHASSNRTSDCKRQIVIGPLDFAGIQAVASLQNC